jgi:hypothetical protein
MTMTSERDVVFTPMMLRVRAVLDGSADTVELRLQPSSLKPLAHANDEWFSLRARSEQVIAEANGMLRGRAPLLDLDDEAGTGRLAFTLGYGTRSVRISMGRADRQAWVQLERSYADDTAPVEPVEPQVLEDLVIELIGATPADTTVRYGDG